MAVQVRPAVPTRMVEEVVMEDLSAQAVQEPMLAMVEMEVQVVIAERCRNLLTDQLLLNRRRSSWASDE